MVLVLSVLMMLALLCSCNSAPEKKEEKLKEFVCSCMCANAWLSMCVHKFFQLPFSSAHVYA